MCDCLFNLVYWYLSLWCWCLKKGWVPVDVFTSVGNMKGIRPQNLCTILPLLECTFPPLLFLHRRPFSCLRRTWWDGVKEDVWRGRVKGELEGRPLNQLLYVSKYDMVMVVLLLNCVQYPFESLFRSLQYAVLDNSCREYLFICDFFMVSTAAALDLFNSIFGKTLAMFMVCGSTPLAGLIVA